jgi:hypothetical protein
MDKTLNSEVIMPQERTDVAVNGEIKDVRISHLCEELEALKEQIRNLSAHKSKLELELATLVSPFKVGDVIKWETARGRFNSGCVVEIKFLAYTCYRSPSFEWTVSRILKNGSSHRKLCSVFLCQKPVLCTQ